MGSRELQFPLLLQTLFDEIKVTGLGSPRFDALLSAVFLAQGQQPSLPTTNGTHRILENIYGTGTDSSTFIGTLRLDAFIGIVVSIVLTVTVVSGIFICRRRSRRSHMATDRGTMTGRSATGYRPLSLVPQNAAGIMSDPGDRISLLSPAQS